MTKRKMRKNNRKLAGFSLMEISIVLLIIGILAGGMLKGKDLIEAAQVRAVINDFQNLQTVFENYVSAYNALPGDDPSISDRFSGASNGSGTGALSQDDAAKVFEHLYLAGFIDSKDFKLPKVGGKYDIIVEDSDIKLRISNNGNPCLNKQKAISIIGKANEVFGSSGSEIVEIFPKISEKQKLYGVKFKIR